MKHTHTWLALATVLLLMKTSGFYAQSLVKITGVTTHYINYVDATTYTATGAVAASGTYTMKFGTSSGLWTSQIQVLDYASTAVGTCFQQIPSGITQTVKLRRVNNTMITGTSSCIWMEGSTPLATGGTSASRLPYKDVMDTVFGAGWFNAGTDNLFDNTVPSNNNNNIERFDVILSTGYVVTDAVNEGIILFERGAAGAHDPLKIAGISALTAGSDPSAYKTAPVSILTSSWGDIASSSITYTVLRKDAGDTKLRPTNLSSTQNRGGVFIPFGALGFSNGNTVYGYSLMGFDVTATTAAAVLSYTNSLIFPTTTQDVNGGLDLIGVTYFYKLVNVCTPVLPIELESFSGEQQGTGNLLKWSTLSEKNNLKFEIQYSSDGNRFFTIGTVPGAGNSSDEHHYAFYHASVTSNLSYYLLKQTDFDGNVSLSNVIVVNNDLLKAHLHIFPNPARENTIIKITGLDPSQYEINIYSLEGLLVHQEDFTISDNTKEFNLHDIKKGQYILKINDLVTGFFLTEKLFVE